MNESPDHPEGDGHNLLKHEIRMLDDLVQLIEHLGSGSFGGVFKGIWRETGVEVAVKIEEPRDSKRARSADHEGLLYRTLSTKMDMNQRFISHIFWFGKGDNFIRFLVMELQGNNLDTIMNKLPDSKMGHREVLHVTRCIIKGLRWLHQHGVIHRDIKPENFAIGNPNESNDGQRNQVKILDLGLSKWYRDLETGVHVPNNKRDDGGIPGTARYVSLNVHHGNQPSRRDDLASVAYMMVYLSTGTLPWVGLRAQRSVKEAMGTMDVIAKRKFKNNLLKNTKKATKHHILCQGVPSPVYDLLGHSADQLTFDQEPRYEWLLNQIQEEWIRREFDQQENPHLFAWDRIKS